MTETRKLCRDDLRRLCISKNWYTKGDNAAYTNLLNMAGNSQNVTTRQIAALSEDILKHSETEHQLTSICFEIAKICISYFSEAE